MELSQYAELFLSESREHVSAINHLLLALEANSGSQDAAEGVFRSVHTIKGMSATMGYQAVADLAHEMENLLDQLRQGRVKTTDAVLDLLFTATDALERAIDQAVGEAEAGTADALGIITALRVASGAAADPATSASVAPAARAANEPSERTGELVPATWEVRLRVEQDSPLPGVRAFLAVRRAREFGQVVELSPAEAEFDEPDFRRSVTFRLLGDIDPDAVRGALASVGELAEVYVEPARAEATDARLGASGEASTTSAAARTRSVRVDLRRLDALMNGVGELVIVRDRLRALVPDLGSELGEAVDQAARLIGELQDEIVSARMAPVWQVFDRFPRLVRDAARALGKQVDFVIEGKEIELDRSMLDEIGDPLVHLLRNSLDHGIEPPAERRAKGKPETGTLRLSASRQRSRVMIRVSDDGRGIQRDRVLAKAVSSGLVGAAEAATIDDAGVLRLLTTAGFSTAEQVTDVSGRGVGLDVVANRIRGLGGTLEIQSEPGRGSTFTLQLPLTLAIVRALLVRLGAETYALPLAHVGETVQLEPDEVGSVGGREVADLRDEIVPLLSLRALLRAEPATPRADGRRLVVVLEVGEQRLGLEVDRLLGQQEIVVKSFDAPAAMLRIFSGATILSDGRPALILDAGSVAAAERAAPIAA